MYKVSIPEISDEELWKRYRQVKPILKINGIRYWLRDYSLEELKNAYFFDSKSKNIRERVDMHALEEVPDLDFECLHTYSFPAFFNPTIAEVLAQIPVPAIYWVVAFEIIKKPEAAGDFNTNPNAFNQGFHSSTIRLYKRKR